MTLPEILLWVFGGSTYLAVGAVVIGFLDRCDPAYDYDEWWVAGMVFWPLIVVALPVWMLANYILVEILVEPLRRIYHWVRLRGRDKEL